MSELHPKMGELCDEYEHVVANPGDGCGRVFRRVALEAQRAIEADAWAAVAELALEKRDAIKSTNHGTAQRRMALEGFAETLRIRAARIRKGEG